METSRTTYQNIIERLSQLRTKRKLIDLLYRTTSAVGLILLAVALSLMIESIFHFGASGRIGLNMLLLGIILFVLGRFLIFPLIHFLWRPRQPGVEQIALLVGNKYPDIKDHLSNAIQIYRQADQNKEGYSPDLIQAALMDISSKVAPIDFNAVVDYSALKKSLRFTSIVSSSLLIMLLLFFSHFEAAAQRLLKPTTSFVEKIVYQFQIQPGNTQVIKGKTVELSATINSDEYLEAAYLSIQNLVSGVENEWYLHATTDGTFKYTLENVTDSMTYYFRIHEQKSPVYKIDVIELPLIRDLQIKLNFPDYTKLPTRFLDENVGDIVAIKGTRATFSIQSNKLLDSARVVFKNRKLLPLRTQANEATGYFQIIESTAYSFQLVDQEQLSNDDPIQYQIDALEDHYPAVKITVPASDVDVTGDMRLIVMAEAEDDFGFTSARLNYQIMRHKQTEAEPAGYYEITNFNPQAEQIVLEYDWDLSQLKLNPSDWVQYHVEVFDNDIVSGPKSAKSLTYTLRYPSLNEMYEEMNTQQDQADQSLEQILQESKELKEKMSEIVEELKKDPTVSWEEKQNIEKALETQQKLVQELEQAEKKIENLIERIEKNDLLSLETLEKYRELQELFEEIATPEMKRAMQELQQAIENFDPKKLQQEMEKMEFDQEAFLRSLERTISLLKRLQIEQKLDEIVKKAEALAQQQKELSENAQNASPDQGEKLAEEQAEIMKNTEALQKMLQELAAQMAEFPNMPLEQIQNADKMLTEQQLLQQMQQAMQNLQQGDMKSGAQKGQKTQQTLQNLASMLAQAKAQMLQNEKGEMMAAMRRSAHELLGLSKSQEELMDQSKELSANNPRFNELAEKQLNLMRALSRTAESLMELSKKTFFITPEIGKALGKTINGMRNSLDELEGRDGTGASRNQAVAMGALNDAVRHLRESMQNLNNASCSSGGMEQLLQQLQAAAGQQQGLNFRTQQLGEAGSLSLSQQAELARIAAEQRQLQKMLEELNKEFGNGSEILGRLDEIAREMGEVGNELIQQPDQVSSQIINRQQRILSRLLDAQRSMRSRDYSKKRESEKGKNYLPRSIAGLPRDLGEKQIKMREDLLKALKEGYSRDYKELIKRYFEALSKGMISENEKQN